MRVGGKKPFVQLTSSVFQSGVTHGGLVWFESVVVGVVVVLLFWVYKTNIETSKLEILDLKKFYPNPKP